MLLYSYKNKEEVSFLQHQKDITTIIGAKPHLFELHLSVLLACLIAEVVTPNYLL